jgi:hypothetical protein
MSKWCVVITKPKKIDEMNVVIGEPIFDVENFFDFRAFKI